MKVLQIIHSGNAVLDRIAKWLQPVILLIFRLTWGWQFFQTGLGKLRNHANVVEFFTSLGIPAPALNAWFVGGVECIGGLLLLIGLWSRPVAFILAGNMLVAYLTVEEDRAALLEVFSQLDPFLKADPFFFLLTSAIIFAFGAGLFSADALIARLKKQAGDMSSCTAY